MILLSDLSRDTEKRAVAVRTALRGFGGLDGIDAAPWDLSEKIGLSIKLHALRAIFIAWCELLYDGVRPEARREAFSALNPLLRELDEALPDFYERNIISSDYAVASWQDRVEAGRRAARLVEAIDTLEFRSLTFDEDRTYSDLLDNLSLYGPDGHENLRAWRAAQEAAIGCDREGLRRGRMSSRDLVLAPLWPNSAAAALETNLVRRKWRQLGENVKIWLRERKDGSLVMGKDPDSSAARMVRIANLPPDFWNDRLPADTLYALDYSLHGDLDNPHWGSVAMKRPQWMLSSQPQA